LLQSSTLLKVVDDLLMNFCSEAGHQTVLFGTKSCPGIMINQDDDRNLRVLFPQMDKFINLDGGTGPIGVHIPGSIGDRMHLTNYREREIVISPAFGYVGVRQTGDAAHELRKREHASIVSNYKSNLGDSIFNSVVSIGIGAIPGLGTLANGALEIGGEIHGILSEQSNIQNAITDINHLNNVGELSNYIYSRRLNMVLVSENGVYQAPELWFSRRGSGCVDVEYIPLGRPELN